MKIPQIADEFGVWTDNFIILKMIDLKSININNYPSAISLFLIEIRVQEFFHYPSKKENSIEEEPGGPFIVEFFIWTLKLHLS